MEAALVLFCRWCSRKFNCKQSRYTHEDKFHLKEKKANSEAYSEPDTSLFVKCTICSIYTTRDLYVIQSHESSEHHLRKVPKQKAQNQRLTGPLSSVRAETAAQLLQPLPLPPRAQEVVDTSYPRFIVQTGLAAAASAAAEAAAAAEPAAAVAPAEATTVAAADHGFSYELEDPNYVFMPHGNSRDRLH